MKIILNSSRYIQDTDRFGARKENKSHTDACLTSDDWKMNCRGLFLASVLLRGVDSLKYTKTPLTSWGSSQLLGRFCVAKGLGKSSADLRVKVELTYPLLAQGVRVILHSGDRTSYTKAFIRGTCAEQHAAANVLLGTGRTLSEPIFDGSTMKRRFMNSEQNKLVVENSTQWWSIDGVQSSGEVSVRNAYPSAAAVNSTHWAVNYEVSLKSSGYSTLPITDTDKFIYAVLVNCDPEQCALNRPCYGALQGVSVTAELRSSAKFCPSCGAKAATPVLAASASMPSLATVQSLHLPLTAALAEM